MEEHMIQNWKCPNCQAINHPRRTTCWQCGYVGRKPTPANPPVPILNLNRTIYHRAPQIKLSDKLSFLVLSLGAFLFVVVILTESLRKPNVLFDWWSVPLAVIAFAFGLLFSASLGRRVLIIEIGVAFIAGAIYVWTISRNSIDANLTKTANAVCQGKALSSTTDYNPQLRNHPIVIVYQSTGKSLKASNYPDGWLPTSTAEMQLVACIQESWKTIERCAYENDSFMEREQHSLVITVLTAFQGRLVDKIELKGGLPEKCKDVEEFREKVKTVRGSEVSLQQILEQLAAQTTQ
jgi:hypothetical protein